MTGSRVHADASDFAGELMDGYVGNSALFAWLLQAKFSLMLLNFSERA